MSPAKSWAIRSTAALVALAVSIGCGAGMDRDGGSGDDLGNLDAYLKAATGNPTESS
jgi:hypothetical protein